ncbi:MAG: tetratricopeptide repeat protein, partial [Tenericutes bacterium]|nr:tetratricopeptide repeat protein [Mycoplasmatota bacterium]
LLTITLLISFSGFSQDNTDCWQCILASETEDLDLTMKECSSYIDIYKSGKSVSIARYVLAKTNMEMGRFNEALYQFSSIKTSSSFFSSIIYSLQGDCYLELGELEKATKHYKVAIISDYNDLTPYYIKKALIVARKIGNKEDEQYYLRTIEKYFPQYLMRVKTSSYLLNEDGNFMKLNPKKITQPEDMGYGTIYGKKVDSKAFDSMLESSKEESKRYGSSYVISSDQIWESFTRTTMVKMECDNIGINMSNEELNSYIFGLDGYSVPDALKQLFVDQDGNFDRLQMELYITELDSVGNNTFNALKMSFGEKRLNEKMMFLFNNGYFLNSLELEEINEIFTSKKRISYLFKRYHIPSNKTGNTSDLELIEYYKKHYLDSEYNVYDEEREILIVNIPSHNGEDYISELLNHIREQLNTTPSEYDKVKAFTKIIDESNLYAVNINIRRNDQKFRYRTSTKQEKKEIRELAFSDSSKVGDLLTLTNPENTHIKIAILASIKNRNSVPFESVKEKLLFNYIKTKDAEIISNDLESINLDEQLSNIPNIEYGDTIIEGQSNEINGLGYDPKIISFIFNINKNGVWSDPISGQMGVYRFKVLNNENSTSSDDQIDNYKEGIKRDHFYRVNSAITVSAQIIDNRWSIEPTN